MHLNKARRRPCFEVSGWIAAAAGVALTERASSSKVSFWLSLPTALPLTASRTPMAQQQKCTMSWRMLWRHAAASRAPALESIDSGGGGGGRRRQQRRSIRNGS